MNVMIFGTLGCQCRVDIRVYCAFLNPLAGLSRSVAMLAQARVDSSLASNIFLRYIGSYGHKNR